MRPIKRFVRAMKSVFDVAYWPTLLRQRARLDKMENWTEIVAEVCRHRGRRSIFSNQYPDEIGTLCDAVRPLHPKIIVEIGTSQGGTLYLFSRLVEPGGLVISIDKPGEPSSVRPVMRAVFRTFGKVAGTRVVTLDCDSHSLDCHAQIERLLAGRKIDLLFIDGDHSYEGVKDDFHTYRQWVSPRGIIAIHDIAHDNRHPTIKVPHFWRELTAQQFDVQDIIAVEGAINSPGIGLVRNAFTTMPHAKVA